MTSLENPEPDLRRLLERYAQREPRRAQGGLANLAGVDFQLRCYLADFVEALARGSDVASAGRAFLEALSDVAVLADGRLTCIQSKRTLTKASLAKAAEEAVLLDEFLEEEAPDLHHAFRFEVVGLAGREDGAPPGWDGVRLPADLDGRRRKRFERMLAEGRLAPPRLAPDPWWRVIVAAWPHLDDPFAFAREALDLCLRRGLDPAAAERTRDGIAEAFVRRRQRPRAPGAVLGREDVEPKASQSKEVVLGQVPKLGHLRDGRFMARPEQVDAALADLDRHAAERERSEDAILHAFWIEGRSGNGKSVLLLQLMQRLVLERASPVVWLDDASDALLPLLEAWARAPEGAQGPCYVFVDDFYAPNKRGGIALPEIARLLRRHERRDWPVLVTCGPPEHRQDWEAGGGDEAFRVARWLLPPARSREKERLRQWFHERTGREGTAGPAFEQEEGLMISMMFELREGRMVEFVRRFHQRLQALGLVDSVILPLALNRLYIWAPGSWLDDSESDALRRLNQDQDLDFLSLRGQPGEYMRITHPHLSDGIYEAVRELADGVVRARDLHRAFAKALDTDPDTAQLILHRVANEHERLATLDAAELARGMTAAWKARADSRLPEFHAPSLWTSWALWSVREPRVAALLGGGPLVARALETLPDGHPSWPFLWRSLLRAGGEAERQTLLHRGHAWLPGREDRPGWTRVWQDLLEREGELPPGIDPDGLLRRGRAWLAGREPRPEWSFVWQALVVRERSLPRKVTLDELLRDGEAWLAGREGRPEWAFIWERLVDLRDRLPPGIDRDALLRRGQAWLEGREGRPEWTHVLHKLIELGDDLPPGMMRAALLRQGHAWLAGREARAEWAHLWQRLVALRQELPPGIDEGALLRQGQAWLEGREDRPEWTFVWRRLAELGREGPPGVDVEALCRDGATWLEGREDRPHWTHVWDRLLQVRVGSGEEVTSLLRQGQAWLAGREDRPEWAFVWERVHGLRDRLPATGVEALLVQGRAWLETREDRPRWAFVWQKILPARGHEDPGADVVRLLRMGQAWLAAREDHAAWGYVWQRLVDLRARLPTDAERAALLREGHAWLARREDHPIWAYFWEKLLLLQDEMPPAVEPSDLLRQGRAWLAGREDRPEWPHVWRRLLARRDELPGDVGVDALLRQGRAWLAGREDHPAWGHVWETLVHCRDDLPDPIRVEGLLLDGYGWLAGRDERAEWIYVWRRVVNLRDRLPPPIVEPLLRQGWGWMESQEAHPQWRSTWRVFLEAPRPGAWSGLRDEAMRLGYQNLLARPHWEEWPHVWRDLVAHGFQPLPSEPSLDALASEWLRRPENATRDEWGKFWATAWKAGVRDASLLDAAWERVVAHPTRPATGRLLTQLVRSATSGDAWTPPASLAVVARAYLEATSVSLVWQALWGPLWTYDGSAETARLGLRWLSAGPTPRRAEWLVRRLAASERPEVRAEVVAWLRANADAAHADALRQAIADPPPVP